jgi:hypothetical protein
MNSESTLLDTTDENCEFLDICSAIYDLKKERESLVVKKGELQVRLTKIKNLVRSSGLMPQEKYKQCCDSQSKYIQQMQAIEKRLGQIKLQIHKLSDEEHFHPDNPRPLDPRPEAKPLSKEVIGALVALREKYQQFSADHTRVASMRTMAAEFAHQLNPIIRASLKD